MYVCRFFVGLRIKSHIKIKAALTLKLAPLPHSNAYFRAEKHALLLFVKHLSLQHFKNYEGLELPLDGRFVCLWGKNGSGKTNLLDALYYGLTGRSAFSLPDKLIVQRGQPHFLLRMRVEEQENTHSLHIGCQPGRKKVLKQDEEELPRLVDYVGNFLAVFIAPADAQLIHEGSEVRRRLIDSTLSSQNREFLARLMDYNRILKQRNAYLKELPSPHHLNTRLLESYDSQLLSLANYVSATRAEFAKALEAYFSARFLQLAPGKERVSLVFKSQCLAESFEEDFKAVRERDLYLQRTTRGAHRDDLVFLLEGEPLKKFGSQGQQKTYTLALRLATYDYLHAKTLRKPLLMLDDVQDKLDGERLTALLQLLQREEFGQVIFTDTHPERVSSRLDPAAGAIEVFEVREGKVN